MGNHHPAVMTIPITQLGQKETVIIGYSIPPKRKAFFRIVWRWIAKFIRHIRMNMITIIENQISIFITLCCCDLLRKISPYKRKVPTKNTIKTNSPTVSTARSANLNSLNPATGIQKVNTGITIWISCLNGWARFVCRTNRKTAYHVRNNVNQKANCSQSAVSTPLTFDRYSTIGENETPMLGGSSARYLK